jgi:hypothetical protein
MSLQHGGNVMYQPAVFTGGHVATGSHHADAFSHLTVEEKDACDLLVSGHVNEDGSFTSEMKCSNKNLIFVRHVESLLNVGLTDDLDSDITDKGVNQGLGLVDRLPCLDGYVGFVSPYLRCLKTASYIPLSFTVDRNISDVMSTRFFYVRLFGAQILAFAVSFVLNKSVFLKGTPIVRADFSTRIAHLPETVFDSVKKNPQKTITSGKKIGISNQVSPTVVITIPTDTPTPQPTTTPSPEPTRVISPTPRPTSSRLPTNPAVIIWFLLIT